MILDESFLEPFARRFRFLAGLKTVPKDKPLVLVDIGCGPKIRFFQFAVNHKISIKKYIGIDPLINKELPADQKVMLIKDSCEGKIPIENESVDLVVGFAFLEHVDDPGKIIAESLRILKKGGKAVFTTPTPFAKNILEFLAYKLNLISKREIDEHKHYFDRNSLLQIVPGEYRKKTEHKYFELGLNNLLILSKE